PTRSRICVGVAVTPVGLDGSFSQSSSARSASASDTAATSTFHCASTGTGTARRPASSAPIAYVGYDAAGYKTVSREGSRNDSTRGSDATSSFVPTQASACSGETSTPKRRLIQSTTAARSAGVPMVGGYP